MWRNHIWTATAKISMTYCLVAICKVEGEGELPCSQSTLTFFFLFFSLSTWLKTTALPLVPFTHLHKRDEHLSGPFWEKDRRMKNESVSSFTPVSGQRSTCIYMYVHIHIQPAELLTIHPMSFPNFIWQHWHNDYLMYLL